jgi:hypothetical protein
MALGGTIGGILGAAAGTVLLPGLGTTAGASLGTGLGQSIQGAFQKKKAKAMLPPPEDVGERALLNTLRRRQQALSTGTAYNPQITAGKQMAKSFAKNSFNAGGMPNQGAYSAMLNQAMGNVTQQTSQEMAQVLSEQRQLATQMANLKNDRTFLQRNEQMADAAENQKAGFQNLSSALQPKGDFKYNEQGETQDETAKKRLKKILNKSTGEVEVDENGNPI